MSSLRRFAVAPFLIGWVAEVACSGVTTSQAPILANESADDAGGKGSGGGSAAGGGGGGGGSAGQDGGGSAATAAHAPFPTITDHGVPAMTAPKIVAVTFNEDTNASAIASYVTSLGTSAWWQTVMKDYGVGAAVGQSVPVTATLEASYTDDPNGTLPDGGVPTMPAFVVSTITGTPGMPAPDANTIYVFFLPPTTTFESAGEPSCSAAGGYHSSTLSGGTTYVYAVVAECEGAKWGTHSFSTEIDLLTFLSSHEMSEAATDPTAKLTQTSTSISLAAGYYNDFIDDPGDDLSWQLVSDGEIADFCVDQFGFRTPDDVVTSGTATLQRIWSVSAASAGKNPCIPVPSGEVYFNAAPAEGSDALIVSAENVPTTIEVDAFSDGAASWELLALDGALTQGETTALSMSFAGGALESEPGLSVGAIPGIGVSNGTKAELSITLVSALSQANPYATGFLISHDGASLAGATSDHYWPLVVTTSALAGQVRREMGSQGLRRTHWSGFWRGLRPEH